MDDPSPIQALQQPAQVSANVPHGNAATVRHSAPQAAQEDLHGAQGRRTAVHTQVGEPLPQWQLLDFVCFLFLSWAPGKGEFLHYHMKGIVLHKDKMLFADGSVWGRVLPGCRSAVTRC